jgi:MinD-like ATPase involved in chromosome partitioning or flagellar assembly
MTKIIAFHSFRRGAGTSNLLASCAMLLAMDGKRVGIIDTDFQYPSDHILFGLPENKLEKTINDYLWGNIDCRDAVYDVTPTDISGKIYLAPASPDRQHTMQVSHESYETDKLNKAFSEISKAFELNFLMVDTTPGLNEEPLVSLAGSNTLILMLKLDKQDYQGMAVMVSLAQKLEIPHLKMVVNQMPPAFDIEDVQREVQEKYQLPVAAILPHTEEMLTLASRGIFIREYPTHPLTMIIKQLTQDFIG